VCHCVHCVYEQLTHQGVWRTLLVRRSDHTGKLLVCITVCLKEFDATGLEQQWAPELKRLVLTLTGVDTIILNSSSDTASAAAAAAAAVDDSSASTNSDNAAAAAADTSTAAADVDMSDATTDTTASKSNIASLSILQYEGTSAPGYDTAAEVVYGDSTITEVLMGVSFRISAASFFQVNSTGAEVLYQTVVNYAGLQPEDTVIDVCCGTGTIGLCCAKATGCKVRHTSCYNKHNQLALLVCLITRCPCACASSHISHCLCTAISGSAKLALSCNNSVLINMLLRCV
jgi:tRNA/tmRNA/rRNA uracil-C5-methylase (TrmA/RlmC/RlmD family)